MSALDKIHGSVECVAPLLCDDSHCFENARLIIYLHNELPYLSCKECVEEEMIFYRRRNWGAQTFSLLRMNDRLHVYLTALRFFMFEVLEK